MMRSSLLGILLAFSWLCGRRPPDDDADVSACNEYLLDSLSDADFVRTIHCVTERNVRDQMTVAEAQEMAAEMELREQKWRN